MVLVFRGADQEYSASAIRCNDGGTTKGYF